MKAVITGGAGFVGANLCRELARRGDVEIVVLDDLTTGLRSNLDGLDVHLRTGSVLDSDAVAEACSGASSIIHLAAYPSVSRSLADPLRSHEVNVTGTLRILEAARSTGAHVVLASSSSVYGHNPVLPKSEDLKCMPASPYAVSKLAAESYALSYRTCFGMECTAFRFFNIFGPLQQPNHAYAAVIPSFVWAALRGEPLTVFGDGEQSRDFTFVGSVVEILLQSIQNRITCAEPINLAFGTRVSLNEVISMLSALLGRGLEVRYQAPRVGDVHHSQASQKALRQTFPMVEPVSLEAGLRRTIEWMEPLARQTPADLVGAAAT